jgi:hypothetical protein
MKISALEPESTRKNTYWSDTSLLKNGLDSAQFDDLERRDLLHAGRSGYRCGRIPLNLGLQAMANTPSRLLP